MRTYYIQWSSWFNCHKYDADLMSKAVVRAGGENLILTPLYGWDNNMPEVVAFNAHPENLDKIESGLKEALGTEWVIIKEVDWRMKNN